MKTARVKICGITSKHDLITAVDAGADAVGFVVDVPSSARNLTLDVAEKLVKLVPVFVNSIAVTVSESLGSLKRIYEQVKPDGMQIHGEKFPQAHVIREGIPHTHLIKAINPEPGDIVESSLEASRSFDAVLLDSYVRGKYGGTGIVHNWELSRHIRDRLDSTPLILAGGLTPDNVEEAIRIVHPYAVDVSSGVESCPGVKDSRKASEFVMNAKKVRF
ncbi:MAG: phosphoribosylanthranilate isomerase [Candidatus Bathyarchaeia archaeon]